MKQYNDNIEMFDAYLTGMMSDNDRTAFEKMLAEDMELKREFQEHKEFISVLQATCSEADAEFEQALKNISEENMRSIVAENKVQQPQAEEKPKEKVVPLRTVYRWMSAAAVVLLIAGVGIHLLQSRQAINSRYDAIAMTHDFNNLNTDDMPVSRGVGSVPQHQMRAQIKEYNEAMELLENDKTKDAIAKLEKMYQSEKTDKKIKEECEISLAFAYVKNHDIDNAKRFIGEVKNEKGDKMPLALMNLEKALSE